MQHYTWYARAVSVPGPDTDLALYVAFEGVRYLFGAGEGTQRALVQRKTSTKGLTGIFLPDGGSKGRGGLPGLIMTMADNWEGKQLDVIGPSDTTHHVATLRNSLIRPSLQFNTHPHPPACASGEIEDIYDGLFFNVKSIALYPEQAQGSRRPFHRISEGDQIAQDFADSMFFHRGKSEYTTHMWLLLTAEGVNPMRQMDVAREKDTAAHMVYICRAPDIPGKFDGAKAKQLGIPEGPERRRLIQGEAIEFEDKKNPGVIRRVEPSQVVSGARQGSTMIVVNCSEATMSSLINSWAFEKYQPGIVPEGADFEEVAFMAHRVPTAVWQNKAYQDWMASFGPQTQHGIAPTDGYANDVAFSTSAWNTLQLSLLDNDMFSLPHATTSSPIDASILPPNSTILTPNHQIALNPPGKLLYADDRDHAPGYPTTLEAVHAARRDLIRTMPKFAVECAKARQAVRNDPRWDRPITEPGYDITVTTLGTGSALPSLYRNVSCTHLDIPGTGGVLLDVGEGSLGQLRRKFGTNEMKKVYEDLRMIFISHMHADHHLGLQAVLEDRFAHGVTSKLYIIAPYPIAIAMSENSPWSFNVPQSALDNVEWVDTAMWQYGPLPGVVDLAPTDDVEESLANEANSDPRVEDEIVQVPPSLRFETGARRWPSKDIFNPVYQEAHAQAAAGDMMRDLGLVGFRTTVARHRGKAWHLIIQHESGWKIAYSGDTKPNPAFARDGRDATLLIHEASLEDDKEDVALAKGHSTFAQAIRIGREMQAKNILLNHFSQRYPKFPRLHTANGEAGDGIVSISFDMMSVKVADMWRMAYYTEAAETLLNYTPDEETDVEGAMENDVNATLDTSERRRAIQKPKSKVKQKQPRPQKKKEHESREAREAAWSKRGRTPPASDIAPKRPRSEESL